MTKAYVITLTGQGDKIVNIVDEKAWDWVINGGRPDQTVADAYFTQNPGMYEDVDDLIEEFATSGDGSSSPDNDRALYGVNSIFNGEVFSGETITEVSAFIAKHGLAIEEEYDGYIY